MPDYNDTVNKGNRIIELTKNDLNLEHQKKLSEDLVITELSFKSSVISLDDLNKAELIYYVDSDGWLKIFKNRFSSLKEFIELYKK